MKTNRVPGTYGSNKTDCQVLTAIDDNGLTWYCVYGSVNVNATYDDVEHDVDVETLHDIDMFTASKPIKSLQELVAQVGA